MVTIRTPPNQRIFVNWNVQALADAINRATGATNFGTYLGHSPSAERSTDSFSTIPMPRSNRVLGDAIAEYCLTAKMPNGVSVWDYYGIRYIIWRQRINWNDGNGWRLMENRGDDTQNHFDHDHIATNVIPAPRGQTTAPAVGGNDVLIVNVKNTGIFLMRGEYTQHLTHPDHVLEWVKVGVPYQDKVSISRELFEQYGGWSPPTIRGLLSRMEEEETIPYDEMIEEVQRGIDAIHDEYVRSLQVQE